MKRVALYLRVSTGEQTTANQSLALEEVASRRGWNIVQVYEEAGISGAKGREGATTRGRLVARSRGNTRERNGEGRRVRSTRAG